MDQSSIEIEAAGVRKTFGEVVAVDDLSFTARGGEIFGLVGPDGAGKTTTIRMLAGIMAPDSGRISVHGCDVVADPEGVKRWISYMPQRFGLYEDLTIDENIRFYGDLFRVPRSERGERSRTLLEACGLSDFRGRLAGNLSGGMKQKLGLVCALIHTPRVLLLDEPTNGVDPISRREFWAMLYSLLGRGVAILVSTAYLDEAERCHRLALMHEGKLLMCDRPEALKAQMRGAIVSVASAQAQSVKQRLATADGVSGAVLVGDAVHLFVDDASRRVGKLRAILDENSISYDEIEAAQPTIEDLFVRTLEEGRAV